MEKVYQQHWIDLPKDVRQKLAEVFDIERTGITEIRDNTVISDGFTNKDLEAITLPKMTEYIGSDETFHRAWELTLMKVRSELNPPVMEIGVGSIEDSVRVVESITKQIEELPEVEEEQHEPIKTKKTK